MMNSVQSPCVRNCSLNEQRVCRGCFRTLEEIVDWSEADEDARRRILERVTARRGLQDALDNGQHPLPA